MDSIPPESVEILDQIDESSTKSQIVELADGLKCSQQSDFDDGKLKWAFELMLWARSLIGHIISLDLIGWERYIIIISLNPA